MYVIVLHIKNIAINETVFWEDQGENYSHEPRHVKLSCLCDLSFLVNSIYVCVLYIEEYTKVCLVT